MQVSLAFHHLALNDTLKAFPAEKLLQVLRRHRKAHFDKSHRKRRTSIISMPVHLQEYTVDDGLRVHVIKLGKWLEENGVFEPDIKYFDKCMSSGLGEEVGGLISMATALFNTARSKTQVRTSAQSTILIDHECRFQRFGVLPGPNAEVDG